MSTSMSSLLSSNYSTSSSSTALNISNILASTYGSSTAAIDVTAAVSAAIYSARAPERLWESEIVTLSNQTADLEQIQSATNTLVTDLQNLNSLFGVMASRKVTSSNSSYVTATASKGAATGSHAISVNHLATKESWYSDTVASTSSTLPASSITITTASGSSVSFDTGSGTSGDNLKDLAAAINSSSMGVTASIVNDSKGARLAIVSNSTGLSNGFSIAASNFTGATWTSQALSEGSTLGANTITVTGSGTDAPSISVTTADGDSYSDLVSDINAAITAYNETATANSTPTLNVTATLTTASDGSTTFTLASTDETDFTVNQPAFGMSEGAAAQNAEISVDGIPLSSASNTVTGAVSGVTMYLLGAYSGAEFNLTVSSDVDSISSAINQFVSDYNTVAELVNAEYTMTSTTDSSGNTQSAEGPLSADPTLSSFQRTIQSLLTYVSASTSGSSSISMLSSLGVSLTNEGTLSVDTTMLSDVLTNSATEVQDFFQGEALNGFAKQGYAALKTYTSLSNGAFKLDLSSISSQSSDLEEQIADFESGYISNQIILLTAQFTSAEQALQSLSTTMKQINALLFPSNSNS